MAVRECRQVRTAARPASLLHRLQCPECRRALAADRAVWLAVACRRAVPPRPSAVADTFAALGLNPQSVHAAKLRARRAAKAWRRRAAALTGALVLSAGGWLWHLDRDPLPGFGAEVRRGGLSTVPQGTGSAFDLLTTASQATVKPDRVRAVLTSLEKGDQIAARASAAVDRPDRASWQEVGDLLDANAAVLAQARKALALPFVVYLSDPNTSLFNGTDMRHLSELMALNARLEAHRGRYAAAMSSALEAMELGAQIQSGTGTIGRLVGSYMKLKGRSAAWDLVDSLDAAAAEQAARRIERIAAQTPPLSSALQAEQAAGVARLAEWFREPRGRWLALASGSSDGPGSVWTHLAVLRYSKADILRNYMTGMAKARALADAPYQAGGLPAGSGPQVASGDPVSQMLLYDISALRLREAHDRATQGLLQCALALRAYHAAHRAYPASLGALAGTGMSEAPADPFNSVDGARTFRYRRDGNGYKLYSVGPDRVDDGGEPLVTGGEPSGNPSHRVLDATSQGDLLAGNGWRKDGAARAPDAGHAR